MKKRICHSMERLASGIPEPSDYFSGRRRPAEEMPDNVLLFARRKERELRPRNIATSLHQRWVLILALRGAGTVEMDRVPTRLAPGRALLVPPLHLHAYSAVDANPLWLFATFEWPAHTALGESWQGSRRLDSKSLTMLQALISTWRAPQADGLLAAAHLLLLLRRLFPRGEQLGPPQETSRLISDVRAAVASEPGNKLNAVAKRVGLSESHLRTRFRREAGISLGRYLREVKLRQAAVWLREEGLSVKLAAERAGYPDIYTFSRAFKKSLGVPPSRLRPAPEKPKSPRKKTA